MAVTQPRSKVWMGGGLPRPADGGGGYPIPVLDGGGLPHPRFGWGE